MSDAYALTDAAGNPIADPVDQVNRFNDGFWPGTQIIYGDDRKWGVLARQAYVNRDGQAVFQVEETRDEIPVSATRFPTPSEHAQMDLNEIGKLYMNAKVTAARAQSDAARYAIQLESKFAEARASGLDVSVSQFYIKLGADGAQL